MKRPMIVAALGAGIISLISLSFSITVMLCVQALVICLFIISFIALRKRELAVIFLILTVVAADSYLSVYCKVYKTEELSDETVDICGTVVSEFYNKENKCSTLYVTKSESGVPSNIKINIYGKNESLNVGDNVHISAEIKTIEKNKSFYYSKNIFANAFVRKVLSVNKDGNLISAIAGLRSKISELFVSNLSFDTASTVLGLTVGDRYLQSDEYTENVRNSGVSHIMVVSGMHMAVICGAVLKMLKTLRVPNSLSVVICTSVVLFIMLLCGFTPSILRAGITYLVFMLSNVVFRVADSKNTLALSVIIIIILNPFSMGNVSFLLSVSSVTGILTIYPHIIENVIVKHNIKNKIAVSLINAAAVTLSAYITTFPVSVWFFETVSVVSLFTNILISFAVTVALISAFAAMATNLLIPSGIISQPFYLVTAVSVKYFNAVINFFGGLRFSTIDVNKYVAESFYFLILAILFVLKYTYFRNKREKEGVNNADNIGIAA